MARGDKLLVVEQVAGSASTGSRVVCGGVGLRAVNTLGLRADKCAAWNDIVKRRCLSCCCHDVIIAMTVLVVIVSVYIFMDQ